MSFYPMSDRDYDRQVGLEVIGWVVVMVGVFVLVTGILREFDTPQPSRVCATVVAIDPVSSGFAEGSTPLFVRLFDETVLRVGVSRELLQAIEPGHEICFMFQPGAATYPMMIDGDVEIRTRPVP